MIALPQLVIWVFLVICVSTYVSVNKNVLRASFRLKDIFDFQELIFCLIHIICVFVHRYWKIETNNVKKERYLMRQTYKVMEESHSTVRNWLK